MDRWWIIFMSVSIFIPFSFQAQTIWKPVTVSESTLQNSTLIKKQINEPNDIACSIFASRQPWAKLFCVVDGACNISSYLVVPYPSQTPIADPVECMTNIDGCLDESKVYPLGHYYCPTTTSNLIATTVYHCIEGVFVPLGRPPPRASCISPFVNTPYGCIVQGNSSKSWCEGRMHCQILGGDLLMLDTIPNTSQLRTFTIAYNGPSYMHFGGIGNNTYFEFLNGKRLFLNSTMWHSSKFPAGAANPGCGLVFSNDGYGSYGFSSYPCGSTNQKYYCQIDLAN